MNDLLADRLRTHLTGIPSLTEKKMFGGLCFLIHGNMVCALTNKDDLMLRVGPDRYQDLLAHPQAREMDFTGRAMKGFLFVNPAPLTEEQLATWLQPALTHATSLPKK